MEEVREFDFNFITNFDVKEIIKKVQSLPDEDWDGRGEMVRSEKYADGRHVFSSVKTYPISELGFGDLSLLIQIATILKKPLSSTNICKDKELWALIEPIVLYLEGINPGKARGTIVLSKLLKGQEIPDHRDYIQDSKNSDFLIFSNKTRRYHIPLITNEKSLFKNGETTIHMNLGECWEINKANMHSVTNNGDEDRVHLIVDMIPVENIWE